MAGQKKKAKANWDGRPPGTEREPSVLFITIQPAQDIVATKRQSPHDSLQSKGEYEPHGRIKELEDGIARLTMENHLLKE